MNTKNKKTLLIVFTFSLIFVFLLGNQIIPLFRNGITVKHQVVTGPQFIVIKGEKLLKESSIETFEKNISYSEFFVSDERELYEDRRNFPNQKGISNFIVHGKIIDYKSISQGDGILFPVIKINKILPIEDYYVLCFLFLWFLMVTLVCVLFLIFKKNFN